MVLLITLQLPFPYRNADHTAGQSFGSGTNSTFKFVVNTSTVFPLWIVAKIELQNCYQNATFCCHKIKWCYQILVKKNAAGRCEGRSYLEKRNWILRETQSIGHGFSVQSQMYIINWRFFQHIIWCIGWFLWTFFSTRLLIYEILMKA